MNQDLIEEVARQIVNEQILLNWKLYLVTFFLILTSTFVASLIASYAKERGKNLATKADINTLLQKVEETTKVSEQIKGEISDHFSYKDKRRDKLEELFYSISQLEMWYAQETLKILNGIESQELTAPFSKIEMLVSIYFPLVNEELLLLKQCDLPVIAFNLQLESKKEKFDAMKFVECMQPVKYGCNHLRESVLTKYEEELRL